MTRRLTLMLLACVVLGAMAAGQTAFAAGRTGKPNIVLLLADDLGYKDIGCYGCPDIRTPNLDRMAGEGVRFTSFYTNGAECTPTRCSLLTGRYQHRVGGLECAIGIGSVGRYDDAIRLAEKEELGLPVEHTSIARLLKDAGYATAICGKWHLGYQDKFSPNRHGFDHAFYALGGGMDYFHHVEDPPAYEPVLRLNEKPITRDGYFTDLVAEEATGFINKNAEKPFFLYVPFTSPHAPYQGPAEKQPQPLPAGSPRWKQGTKVPEVYGAMIERMDEAIGKILATLKERGVEQNTMVIFLSDNGGTGSARPFDWRGQKGSLFEGGIRVPCVVRWPGKVRAGRTSEMPGLSMDLTASIAAAAGVAMPPERPLDGVDIISAAEQGKTPERMMFWRHRRGERTWKAARDGGLKLVTMTEGGKKEEYLFDVVKDPKEETNLIAERAADVERLRKALGEWEVQVKHTR